MDLHMPGLNGIQVTRHIKRREHPPVVIIITSDDSPATKEMAEKAGADGFVIKDRNLRPRLIHALRDVFGPSGARREAAVETLTLEK
jgi:CheY-like chemotaxis protein